MSDQRDDPREVLALLNSLGFIGITAQQLKAFMKDLKIYRKIKECERQQRKEEIRDRILQKQRHMVKEIINEQSRQRRTTDENYVDTTDSDSDESLVKEARKVRTTRREREVLRPLHFNKESRKSRSTTTGSNEERSKKRSNEVAPTRNECRVFTEIDKYNDEVVKGPSSSRAKQSTVGDYERPTSAPNILKPIRQPRSRSISTDRGRSARSRSVPRSRSSTYSRQKSFIRSWKLQQGAQRNPIGKSDPVTLYQKYQEEWKRIPFPGEAKHIEVRWAVRERMLGTDPRPMPLQRQTKSIPVFK